MYSDSRHRVTRDFKSEEKKLGVEVDDSFEEHELDSEHSSSESEDDILDMGSPSIMSSARHQSNDSDSMTMAELANGSLSSSLTQSSQSKYIP